MIDKDLKNAKILIVDDLQSNIDVLQQLLEMEEYTNVETTTDSKLVMDIVKKNEPDLILLDLLMPNLTGFDIMKLLKSYQEESLHPDYYRSILVLTADISPETKLKALSEGAKDFLSKPFDLIEVSLRIRNLLEVQYVYQQLQLRNAFMEEKIVEFLKVTGDWYR
ncbi:MAG: response regulator [Paludibacter sp.]